MSGNPLIGRGYLDNCECAGKKRGLKTGILHQVRWTLGGHETSQALKHISKEDGGGSWSSCHSGGKIGTLCF